MGWEEKSQVWACESTQLSGNPWVQTVLQSKSIDLAVLWQIIPVALHMTQSACWIAFWWAIGLFVCQPNHLLMTASRRRLHFSKCRVRGDLEISPHNRYVSTRRDSEVKIEGWILTRPTSWVLSAVVSHLWWQSLLRVNYNSKPCGGGSAPLLLFVNHQKRKEKDVWINEENKWR